MQKDPFSIIGVSANCTQAELQDAYVKKRAKYMNDRFLEGEAGSIAAKKLGELEEAYGDAIELLSTRYTIHEGGTIFSAVEDSIKANQLDKAQQQLDAIVERSAEWHYLQAVVFYKKNWMLESRKQLQLALSIEPDNEKYKSTLQRLEEHMRSSNPFTNLTQEANNSGNERSYAQPNNAASGSGDACCKTCQALICADCCCECMGGDCITCC